MDIFEIIMNAVDDFDERFENVLESLNNKIEGKKIDNEDSAEEIENREETNIIDISAEYISEEDIKDQNKIHIGKIDDN
ncbi:hypothetical protein A966_01356 [Brachyspira hampsonii 30446]|uniref:Uncharacterized protein n=1 Tax=Brachyspira hampsonii 30446 TaxID=1289135 RepID=A0A2U4FF09_9SPIR|nr:hypothetical protein [Brachyspira hampsonii]EKV58154.1 hypothetical protein A966_01356 [Brachyspira hampsonii 30446]MBW5394829.1 hypothetical protein [Brachyspira hampsonii]PTY39228.1 hypothetical protein DQ06_00900 [Brachyspira hampsonii bv. II]